MKENFNSTSKVKKDAVLVVGATGFLGPVLVEEIIKSGRKVIAGVRNIEKAKKELPFPGVEFIQVDLNNDIVPKIWEDRLKENNITAVVNNAGIAVAPKGQSMEHVNTLAPIALFKAVKKLDSQSTDKKKIRIVQISTTGTNWKDADNYEYSKTKKETDKLLSEEKELDWVIVKPNVIYEPGRGHLKLETITVLPITPFVGRNDIQPIYSKELGIGVARLLDDKNEAHQIVLDATGPKAMHWGEVFSDTRRALGKK